MYVMSAPDDAGAHGLVPRLWRSSAVRYLMVGAFCFAVDAGLLWVLYDVVRLPLAVATPIAFLASFAVTYTLQRVVAFASEARVAPSVGRYIVLVVANTIATTVIVWGVNTLGAGWLAGKVVAVVATTVWNYFAYRYWVFASPKSEVV
jgi:putative flippase GtrA